MAEILVYGFGAPIGGVQECIKNLIIGARKLKIDSRFNFIIKGDYTAYEEIIKENGGEIYYIPHHRKNLFSNVNNLIKIIREEKNNNKYFYYNSSGFMYTLPIYIAKLFGYKIIVHAHSSRPDDMSFFGLLWHTVNRIICLMISDHCIACSDYAAQWMYGKNYENNSKVQIICNYIDNERFKYNDISRKEIRKQWSLSENEPVFACVGQLVKVKNLYFAFDIFKMILQNFKGARLLILGDGPLRNELRDYAYKIGINSKVTFCGFIDNMDKAYSAIDYILFPSIREGLPLTLVEAQSAGVRCLISNTITTQIDLTDLIRRAGLGEEPEKWVEKLTQWEISDRLGYNDFLKNNGYDIENFAKQILSFMQ